MHQEDSSDDSDHGAHPVHMPDPSPWPFVAGFAALVLGGALVWWARDDGSSITGPALGAALVVALISAFGWAYEDGRMKRRAEEGHAATAREARFTQVVTFAIAEGRLDPARAEGGVLHSLERSDSTLRDLNGFQDLRIIVSAAADGPSQVLVETTWSAREGLASYEETRGTLLDLVNAHPQDVLPGSVQVFDMEVVRDTKDVGFRFGLGAAATVIAGLIVGGFMLGAGVTLFQEDNASASGAEPPVSTDPGHVITTDNKFNKKTLAAPPNTAVTFTVQNRGRAKHNIRFLDREGGQLLAEGAKGAIIDGGITEKVTFTTPAAGNYYFECEIHPTEMTGSFEVKDGAAAPGATAAPAAATPAATTSPTPTAAR